MMNVKKLLKIEYILIYLSIFVFILNVSFKRIASNEFDKIDLVINLISLQNRQPEDFRQLLLPFSYFDQEIETQLNEVLLLINDPKHHDELIEATIQLQYSLRQTEQNLLFGYDCLLYCALFLAVISVLVILYKNFSFKMESNRRKAMNDAQINFSRDLQSPLKNLILFFPKDKNQIEKFPLSDFFSRLQSTLGISAFIFSYFRS